MSKARKKPVENVMHCEKCKRTYPANRVLCYRLECGRVKLVKLPTHAPVAGRPISRIQTF